MNMKHFLILLILIPGFVLAEFSFPYDLHLTTIPGKQPGVMITAHGMAANYQIAESVQTDKTVITFNFPDHDFFERGVTFTQTTFGTVDEILPLLHVIYKTAVIDGQRNIDLYGFSAGGGAIINALGALNSNRFDPNLAQIGIGQKEKNIMLQAIQNGVIILDAPLKSMQELIDFRGTSPDLIRVRERYCRNDMDPIDSMRYLEGLSLNIIVHFQVPDEALSNRDDLLYYNRLKHYNSGKTELVRGNDGGHYSFHKTLWDFYRLNR